MYSTLNANPSDSYDLIIVGAGPVGLAAAYEAAKNNKKILIIEKRSESTAAIRPQVVVLEPARKTQLMNMIGQGEHLDESDISFLDSLSTSAEIKLATVQRFILNRIKNQGKSGAIAPVEVLYETTLPQGKDKLDFKNGMATISTNGVEKSVRFGHLVGADGASSSTLELVNATLKDSEKIARKTPKDMQHLEGTYHLGAYVKISLKNGQEIQLPEKEFVSSFLENKHDEGLTENQLYFLRFDKRSHEKSKKLFVKLGFIGEIPKHLFDEIQTLNNEISRLNAGIKKLQEEEQNGSFHQASLAHLKEQITAKKEQRQNIAIAYVRRSAADYLGFKESDLEVTITSSKKRPEKNSLKVLTFQGGSKQADKAVVQANGHGFYLIGDAYFTPNYPVGHGLNNGLEAAKLLGDVPKATPGTNPDLSSHASKYNTLSANNARFARLIMQGIRWFRKLGIGRDIVADLLEHAVEKREKGDKVDLKESLSHTVLANVRRKADSIEQFLKKKFDEPSISKLLRKGHLSYDIGFISEDCPELTGKSAQEKLEFLQKLSEQNNGIPIFIKSSESGNSPARYSLYRFNRNTRESQLVDFADESLIIKFNHILNKNGIEFKDELNVISNEKVTGELIDAVLSKTDLTDPTMPLNFLPADEEIEKRIQEWEAFLENNPSIVKQYRVEISEQLNLLAEVINKYPGEEVKKLFNNFHKNFKDRVAVHDNALIALAKKGPNKWDASGRAPLYHALQYGDLSTITAILQAGANPNKACKYDFETIFTRRVFEKPEIARVLLAHGANPFNEATTSYFMVSFLGNRDSSYFSPKFGIECLLALAEPNSKIQRSAVTKIAESQILELKKFLEDNSIYEQYLDRPYIEIAAKRISELTKIPLPESKEDQINLINKFVDQSLDNMLKAKKSFFKVSSSGFFHTSKKSPKEEHAPEVSQEIQSKM